MIWNEREHFDHIADRFDRRFNAYGSCATAARIQRRIELFVASCGLKPGALVLELGCGTAEYSRALAARGIRVLGIDISGRMLQEARKKLAPADKIGLTQADAHLLPFSDETFDAVVGNAVLHHLEGTTALAEAYRVLKPLGAIAFSEPNMHNPYVFVTKHLKILSRLLGESCGETAFSLRSARALLDTGAWRHPSVSAFDFLHPCLPRRALPLCERMGRALEKTGLRSIAGSLFITARK